MFSEKSTPSSRRDFLKGKSLQTEIERAGDRLADQITAAAEAVAAPAAGDTVRLSTQAMACDFSVILNPGSGRRVMHASDALDLVHALESQMSVYREESELSQLNRRAGSEAVDVEEQLFQLLLESRRLCVETDGAFDPTSGPLIALWRRCRDDSRIPTEVEISVALEQTGMGHIVFDESAESVRFDRAGIELNLGGIGKGYALDRAAEHLRQQGLDDWLFHGGHSSILACGDHNRLGGWPVGIRNPLFPKQRFATILLKDQAMSTSGSSVQYFRHGGRRYGHILDPRTGWPVEGSLSVTVLAPTAAEADALSTAFFVMGVENARRYCNNCRRVSAILFSPPRRGRRLEPIVCGIADEVLFFAPEELG